MRNSGAYLSVEATLSLMLLASLLALPVPQPGTDLTDLYILQKEDDLLKIWAGQWRELDESVISEDLQFAFPGAAAAVALDGRETKFGAGAGNAVSSEVFFFDGGLQQHKIQLTVFR